MRIFTSASRKPSASMLAVMCGTLSGSAPSSRMWPSGVVNRKAPSPRVPT
jgi:hypothetical protein